MHKAHYFLKDEVKKKFLAFKTSFDAWWVENLSIFKLLVSIGVTGDY